MRNVLAALVYLGERAPVQVAAAVRLVVVAVLVLVLDAPSWVPLAYAGAEWATTSFAAATTLPRSREREPA